MVRVHFATEKSARELVDTQSALYGARIISVRDIEENVWCAKYGVRGKIDLALNIDGAKQKIVPLELKTGTRVLVHDRSR